MIHEEFINGVCAINEECCGDNGLLRVKSDIFVKKYYEDLLGKCILIPDYNKHDEVISSFPRKTLIIITQVLPTFAYRNSTCDVVCSSLRLKYKYLCRNYEFNINGKLCVAALTISYNEVRCIPIKYDINKRLKKFFIDGAVAVTSFNLKCIAMRNNFFNVQ